MKKRHIFNSHFEAKCGEKAIGIEVWKVLRSSGVAEARCFL